MLAQANIVRANIIPADNGVLPMKPYYSPANYSMRNSVGYLMRMCTNRVLPQMEALFQDQELTFSQWTTLVALHDGRIQTAGDLAHNICHDAGSLTRLIDQMVKRGLVTRSRSETDRRVVTLVTDAARPRAGRGAGAPGDEFLERAAGRLHPCRSRYADRPSDPAGDGGRSPRAARTGKSTLLISDVPIFKSQKGEAMRKPLALLSALLLTRLCRHPAHHAAGDAKSNRTSSVLTARPRRTFAADWWKAFNDPQVDRLAAPVVANNPTLAGALARMRAAQAQLGGQPGRRPAAGDAGRQRTAHPVQQGLHHSAALWRHLALVRLADRQSQLESGFLGQAGGADRPGARQRRGRGAGCRARRGWRWRAPSPRPISICCWPIRMATSPMQTVARARRQS